MGDRAEREEEMGDRNGQTERERMKEKENRQERKGVERAMEEKKERQEMNGEVRDNKEKRGEDEKGKGNIDRGNEEKEGEARTRENGVESEKEIEGGKEENVAETQEEPIVHNLAGEWELDRSENYDEFLKAIGLNVVARRIATQTTSVIIDIDQTGDQFIIRTLAGPFTPVQTFTVGQTCHIREPDGTRVKLCPRWTSKSLKVECTPIASGSKRANGYTITRQPTLDDRLITILLSHGCLHLQKLQSGNVVCTRVFRKVRKR